MPLSIEYVRSLADIVEPAVAFLGRPVDVFDRHQIVVPTAGAKAWLAAELARRLGTTNPERGDGIVANVEFLYPGTISTLLTSGPTTAVDPWSVEQLTFSILEVLATTTAYEAVVRRAGGPLLAARRIADRFDHYHFRRPGMILEWEKGKANLSPIADAAGHRSEPLLDRRDAWQFELWRQVRETIGLPSPPAREQAPVDPQVSACTPDAVLVAGLQGLSLHQIDVLSRLAERPTASGKACEVRVLLVHPSPALRASWASAAPPVSCGVAPERFDTECPAHVDPLVDAWLRGTREAQWLLATQGHGSVHATAPPDTAAPADSLLTRLKHTVATGHIPADAIGDPTAADASVRIHRCHDLRRQAEVLHDAILHAFREIEGLAAHEVVIVSPQIATLAPHLEAVFNRTVQGKPAAEGADRTPLHLPLLVADRGIREVSPGAELLAAVIELVGSRCSVDAMLAVAAHPLVLAHGGIGDAAVETWRRCIERTKIRWGLDAARRARGGLNQPDLPAHTWRLGLERMLLGALLPDGDPEPALGGVVPLSHVDAADVASLAPLVTIFGIIDDLDRAVDTHRTVVEWCDLLEQALGRLAGDESDDLAVPLRELDALRQAARAAHTRSADPVPVPWHDLKTILAATLTAPAGRQPLRTGVITATSLIPLRGVPFRVVCLAGYDDDAVAPREGDSDDLVERQALLGDAEPRVEVRRALLDCLLAAEERLIITCTGMDVKNNQVLPLVTPLAEFTDFATRHGVKPYERTGHAFSGIEVVHPRHACSRKNFLAGDEGVLGSGDSWSHDTAALAAARALGTEPTAAPPRSASATPPRVADVIPFASLAEFMIDPLWPYVRTTLGINPWRDDDLAIPATLPLELDLLEKRRLREAYITGLLDADDPAAFAASWARAVAANGDVPILGFGDDAVTEIVEGAAALCDLARAEGMPLDRGTPLEITLPLESGTLSGTLERCYPDAAAIRTMLLLRPDASHSSSRAFLRAKMLAVVQLLATRASGHVPEAAVILNQHEDWHPGALRDNGTPVPAAQIRAITLGDAVDQPAARALLAELCGLYRRAAAVPHGCFGDASKHLPTDRAAACEAFLKQLSTSTYATSHEAVVHGEQPEFDAVLPDSAEMLAFFARYHALTHVPRTYRYAPDAP